MKIEEGLAMLELESNVPNVQGFMYPTLIWDDKDVVLIDAGLPNQGKRIIELIENEGINPEKLTKIIITHHDMDHIGSLAHIVNTLGNSEKGENNIEVLAHEIEKPYIQGEIMPIKFTKGMLEKLKKQLSELPDDQRGEVQSMFSSNKPKVTHTLIDNQELTVCGGISIIHTPGHTPGHICIYLKKYKTLIAGDALNIECNMVNALNKNALGSSDEVDCNKARLTGPNPQYTYDVEQAVKSLRILQNFDIQKVICYHGGLISSNVKQQIADLIK